MVNPLGLHGYNCRHSHKPWDIRLRNPYVDENGNLKIDSGENKKRYDLQQKQRAMERAIRKTKRELVTKQQEIDSVTETDVKSILQEDYDKLVAKLTKQNQAYIDFCKDNNLQPQYDRIKAADFSRKQEKATREAAKRYTNSLVNELNGDIINTKAKNGLIIKGVSSHTLERAKERNVILSDNIQSLKEPLHIGDIITDNLGRRSQRFIGEIATVNVNPDTGNITTVWKTGRATRKKYAKKEERLCLLKSK